MTQLSVLEWLLRVKLLVDFSDIGSFLSMLENHWKGPPISKNVFDKIREIEHLAWITPDYSRRVEHLSAEKDNVNLRLGIEFRLRTLIFDFMIWKCPKKGVSVANAFKEMKNAELSIKKMIVNWGASPTVCNVLSIEPFFSKEDDFKNWFIQHNQDLRFFPMGCSLDTKFTCSLSKLTNLEEPVSYLITNIRNDLGIRRRVIILRPKITESYVPHLYTETVWFSFSVLFQHVVDRITNKIVSISDRISSLEKNVLDNSPELFAEKKENMTPTIFKSVLSYYSKLSELENELALVKDDLFSLERNMRHLGKSKEAKYKNYGLSERVISGNVRRVANPQNSIAFGLVTPFESKHSSECSLGHYCILCNNRSKEKDGSELSLSPPNKIGAMEETLTLVDIGILNSRSQLGEINRSMNRTKSLVNNLFSLLSAKANLNLDISLSQNSIEQKNILSKIEAVLETSEKERKLTERIAGTVELLSLLFASFVVGEISSSFILWSFQNIWVTEVPWWVYYGGFFMSISIAGLFFIPIYLFLKRKRKKS